MEFLPPSAYYARKDRHDGLSAMCAPCELAHKKAKRAKRRAELIELMGGECERCGFDDARALQVDHVESDGALERVNGMGIFRLANLVIASPERYALLCANCNHIKMHEQGEWTGRPMYRTIPTERRVIGVGRGAGTLAMLARNRTPEHQKMAGKRNAATANRSARGTFARRNTEA